MTKTGPSWLSSAQEIALSTTSDWMDIIFYFFLKEPNEGQQTKQIPKTKTYLKHLHSSSKKVKSFFRRRSTDIQIWQLYTISVQL